MAENSYIVEILKGKMKIMEAFFKDMKLKKAPVVLEYSDAIVVTLNTKQLQEVTDHDMVSRVVPNNTHHAPR